MTRHHGPCGATRLDQSGVDAVTYEPVDTTWTCDLPLGHEGPHYDRSDPEGTYVRWTDAPTPHEVRDMTRNEHTPECEGSCHPSCPIGRERMREANERAERAARLWRQANLDDETSFEPPEDGDLAVPATAPWD